MTMEVESQGDRMVDERVCVERYFEQGHPQSAV